MFWNILNASIYMKYKIKRPAPINCTKEKNKYRIQWKKFQRKTNQDQWKRVHVYVNVLTNCSRIPLITERVQRTREVMQVTMMRQSNVTVRYMFLEAERKRNQNHLECEKHHNSGFKLFGFGKKTHTRRLLSSLCTRWCQHHPAGQPLSCRCVRCCWR